MERKIGRGRAEITCKNNNGREYRITRPPAFLPVIAYRFRVREIEREIKDERRSERERHENKTEMEETRERDLRRAEGKGIREAALQSGYKRACGWLYPPSQLSAKIFAVGYRARHH